MALGIIIGTYSSIFFASMLLADHRSKQPALKKA
jgi:preprotein translocase subunit SecF